MDIKEAESIFKGLANHWRLNILALIRQEPGLSLEEIARRLGGNEKTISEHTRRLVASGLIVKEYRGRYVGHSISDVGKSVLRSIRSIIRL